MSAGRHSMAHPQPPGSNGFTLIEFIVALVMLAAGAALLTSLVTPAARSADPQIRAQSRTIAGAYMDEILLRAHGPCSNPGAPRGSWEETGCYNGLSEPPADQFGNPIAALAGYQVSVTVTNNAPADIAVVVSHGTSGISYTIQSRRGAY